MDTSRQKFPSCVRECFKKPSHLDEAPSLRDTWKDPHLDNKLTLGVVVCGGSGDLAKKKTYPALFALFYKGFLPQRTLILGYARSHMSDQDLRERIKPFLVKVVETLVAQQLAAIAGGSSLHNTPRPSTSPASPHAQHQHGQAQQEGSHGDNDASFAMGAMEFERAATEKGMQKVEDFLQLCTYQTGEYDDSTPSGTQGYQALADRLAAWESDHPPNVMPMVGRLLYLALPPAVYPQVSAALHRHVSTLSSSCRLPESWVRMVLEKPFGKDLCSSEALAKEINAVWPEESLFRIDHYLGKELVQNMLVLRFANNLFSSWWNRDSVANVQITFKENFGTQGRGGYFDQYGIIRDVMQNHLAQVLALLAMEPPVSLHPDDVRDEKVRIQLKSPAAPLFGSMDHLRNELVIRFQPDEAIYAKLVVKKPGLEMDYVMSELDLTYPERYRDLSIPDAYERLILDCIRGDQQHFVRRDELRAAWAIFTPLLHAIDARQIKPPHPYPYGSRGPKEADMLVRDSGYTKTEYEWTSYEARRSPDGLRSGMNSPAQRSSKRSSLDVRHASPPQ
ncbi:hypothetical protein DUNSADRAFT_5385 [Dunaliella salina]|uniref:glucose-6-phosphate dehydrogenase (NADP(+)) n=1 Tax=Dunaliella salina TaxID=3046 RepID=A0ABQ7GQC7_DUNSA|nr:hypothetical protein DUNSADRAFT_5385 [Dunaliella salina]|eukprot:KAF5836806.1 hypothetical protein DUNSADRAFT_5385 [Dunaliella salina]